MARKVTNTARQAKDDPMTVLAEAFVLGASRSIEASEAEGQRELVESDQIPVKLMHGLTEAMLEQMGLRLGPPTPDDRLFRSCTLPPGWSRRDSDHPMWSYIVDERGRERLAMFYKAAFYDRRADMDARCRFGFSEYLDGPTKGEYTAAILDCGKPIVTFGVRSKDAGCAASDAARQHCESWLNQNRPDWRNPMAYWDAD